MATTMTRQHFELIARTLASVRPTKHRDEFDTGMHAQWGDSVSALANALATTNPNFDRARFVAAATKEV